MSEVIGDDLKGHRVLDRRERWTLIFGTPLFITILCVEVLRVWTAIRGEPLMVTSITEPDLVVGWTGSPIAFLLGLGLHLAIILFLTVVLAVQVSQVRRWLRAKRGT